MGILIDGETRRISRGLKGKQEQVETAVEGLLFGGRWLLAPLYLGLLVSLIPLAIRFARDFFVYIETSMTRDMHYVTVGILELLDTVLLGNLIIIVIFAGYENFVSKINIAENSPDRPHWMGRVDYSGLKIKLIGSLVAVSVIELLKDFMSEGEINSHRETWRIIIHLTFVLSGLLFAVTDYIGDRREKIDLEIDQAQRELESARA